MSSDHQRLLGRLAETSLFMRSGEVIATKAVAMLLEIRSLREAFESIVEKATTVDVSGVRAYLPEAIHQDGARPDVEGVDVGDRPLVVIEAKFGARLGGDQVASYLQDQAARLSSARGVFVLLVPEVRLSEATYIVEEANASISRTEEDQPQIVPMALSWRDLIDSWDEAVRSEAGPDSVAADLVQLRAMCLTLGGLVIPPLGPSAAGAAWREREAELRVISDQVTQRLANTTHLPPIGDGRDFIARRYFPANIVHEGGEVSWGTIGIRTDLADAGLDPIWLRFNKSTPGFARLLATLLATDYRDVARRDGNHLWLPLPIDGHLTGPALVDSLVAEYQRIEDAFRH